ncbi:winged helix-turn-helix transcriptional regulator [Thalassotalea sp. PLHSN55]|uniref:winged helix-turn-helix transcriptional regulator n=1 Tax=Thalassotalea sp. PLHSN55 TaxID=3435888 RepID=UPI003F873D30
MRWQDIDSKPCSVARSIAIFGDRWTLLILRQIFLKVRRFSQLQHSLQISRHRLSDRLTRLVDANVLHKSLYDESHQRFEYRLTDKGKELFPIIIAITNWGDKWQADSDGVPIQFTHTSCGNIANAKLTCSCCSEVVNVHNMSGKLGPGITNKINRGELNKDDFLGYEQT